MQAVVIDEVADPREARSVQSISHRGVMCVATTHGSTLGDVLGNHVSLPALASGMKLCGCCG